MTMNPGRWRRGASLAAATTALASLMGDDVVCAGDDTFVNCPVIIAS
jgi:cyanophycinase-like exopeptidase